MAIDGQADALLTAVQWLRDTLLGSVASSIAVIAVASVGLGMLSGRLDWRRGARMVVGCFILFGAPSIAAGLMTLTSNSGADSANETVPPVLPTPLPTAAALPPASYDPYAGASVPIRR